MKGIYAITPNGIEENELIEKSQELIEAKIDFLQIRRKADTLDQIYSVASKIIKFTKNHSCKLIINDHIEIAKDFVKFWLYFLSFSFYRYLLISSYLSMASLL